MAPRGRPAVTQEVLQGRIDKYCTRYKVSPNEKGLPPFPTGRRETPQHREWISLLKAHTRLRRRTQGLCRRCDKPAAPGATLCEEHLAPDPGVTAPADSKATCFLCQDALAGAAVQELESRTGPDPELVHPGCAEVIALAEKVGPDLLDRIRQHLWPDERPRPRGRRSRQ